MKTSVSGVSPKFQGILQIRTNGGKSTQVTKTQDSTDSYLLTLLEEVTEKKYKRFEYTAEYELSPGNEIYATYLDDGIQVQWGSPSLNKIGRYFPSISLTESTVSEANKPLLKKIQEVLRAQLGLEPSGNFNTAPVLEALRQVLGREEI